jgi:hypothetical protein
MDTATSANRRGESRLRYNWPVWISLDAGHDRVIQGQMVDLNSHAAAFTFRTHEAQPWVNQNISTRFGVPQGTPDAAFEVVDFIRHGHIHRVDQPNPFVWRVVMQFHEPLPFRPADSAADADRNDELETATA